MGTPPPTQRPYSTHRRFHCCISRCRPTPHHLTTFPSCALLLFPTVRTVKRKLEQQCPVSGVHPSRESSTFDISDGATMPARPATEIPRCTCSTTAGCTAFLGPAEPRLGDNVMTAPPVADASLDVVSKANPTSLCGRERSGKSPVKQLQKRVPGLASNLASN
ncbi:hypothetical protein EDB84DRAFT_353649 [Lactarius hengduanensis]|nr:hypothetical protein EDB84DRAFT_353649 [Lactarius hengduanensis]